MSADTITTIELAKEVGLTGKSIRMAVHRIALRATRVSKGLGRTASATEFVIYREEADNWKQRRMEKKRGVPYPVVEETQAQRRQSNHHAFFASQDGEDGRELKLERLKRDALKGSEQARSTLRLQWEQGGVALVRWWRRGVGEIV